MDTVEAYGNATQIYTNGSKINDKEIATAAAFIVPAEIVLEK